MSKTILVLGATGMQGGAVVQSLLRRGATVRGVTRRPEGARGVALQAAGVALVSASMSDEDALAEGMAGADGVFALTTPFEGGPDDELLQGRAMINAASRAGVSHFVFSSVGSADDATGVPHFESKFEVEQVLQQSGLNHTILRPVYFMENILSKATVQKLGEGTFALPMSPERALQQVCAPDYGEVVAEVLLSAERFAGRAIDVASDELTGEHEAQTLAAVLGHEVAYKELPSDALGPPGRDMRLMFEWFESTGYRANIAALREEFPNVRWHSFADWARAARERLQ